MPDSTYLELVAPGIALSAFTVSPTRRGHPLANNDCDRAVYAFLGVPLSPSPHSLPPPLSTLLNDRLLDAGSSTRYGAKLVVSRKQDQPSDGGNVELVGEITA